MQPNILQWCRRCRRTRSLSCSCPFCPNCGGQDTTSEVVQEGKMYGKCACQMGAESRSRPAFRFLEFVSKTMKRRQARYRVQGELGRDQKGKVGVTRPAFAGPMLHPEIAKMPVGPMNSERISETSPTGELFAVYLISLVSIVTGFGQLAGSCIIWRSWVETRDGFRSDG